MSVIIEDGAGGISKLKINSKNQAEVASTTQTDGEVQALAGKAWMFHAPSIQMDTGGTKQVIMWLKNTGSETYKLKNLTFSATQAYKTGSIGESGVKCLEQNVRIEIISNPTSVDFVKQGNEDINPLNQGTTELPKIEFFKSPTGGGAKVGGSVMWCTIFDPINVLSMPSDLTIILPPDKTLALTWKATAANIDQDLTYWFNIFEI